MKKNIIIIILIISLVGALVGIFVLVQKQTTCPACKVCMCDEKNCPKLEKSDEWSKLATGSFIQNVYESSDKISNTGVIVTSKDDLLEYISDNKDKNKIIEDFEKYDLENGTYILFESGTSGCGGSAPGIKEVLIKDDNAILVKNTIKTSFNESTCMEYISNVYGIYIPLKISSYSIVK